MFLFDIDASSLAADIKRAVVASLNNLGLNQYSSARWYDFLADLDPLHVQRCQFCELDRIEIGWSNGLRLAYRLFLGRTPEAPRFEEQATSLSELVIRILMSDEFRQKRTCIRYLRGPAFNHSPKLIVLHVPRTGGTYFTGALRSAFPRRYAACYDLDEPTWMLDAAFASIFSAHFSRSLYRTDAGHLFVAAVRAPRDRFCSRARYHGLSLTLSSDMPSYLLDEAVPGFQSRFIFGDHLILDEAYPDGQTLLIPFSEIGSVVAGLFEQGICTIEPGSIFRNQSPCSFDTELPEEFGLSLDEDSDHQLCNYVSESFSLARTLDHLSGWLATDPATASQSIQR